MWRRIPILLISLFYVGGLVEAQARGPLLPPDLAGWQVAPMAPPSAPAAAAMREFGLQAYESALLTRGNRQVHLEAWKFGDASGGFGAFTYFRSPAARQVKWAQPTTQAALDNRQAWGWRNHWVLHLTAAPNAGLPGQGEIGAMLAALPRVPQGSHALPVLPLYLPARGLVVGSVAYAEGPAALAHAAPWLPAGPVGFDRDAEVVVANYRADSLAGQLALIGYPTPQVAQDRLAALGAAGMVAQRTGTMLVIWHGPESKASRSLVGSLREHSVVTWTKPPGIESLPALILGIFALVGVIIVVSLAAGFATSGARALLARIFPRRFPLHSSGARFIRLNLR